MNTKCVELRCLYTDRDNKNHQYVIMIPCNDVIIDEYISNARGYSLSDSDVNESLVEWSNSPHRIHRT